MNNIADQAPTALGQVSSLTTPPAPLERMLCYYNLHAGADLQPP